MPAFAIVTVYYSITSWIATLSSSLILSNSSIQTIPLSARTIAPAAKYLSPVSLSKITAAVKPTPEVPLPVVLITNGAIDKTLLNNYDFAVDGSPITRILISPLKCVPFSRVFSIPPSNISNIANLISSCPYIDGAIDYDNILSTSYFSANDFIFLTSSIVTYGYSISVIITFMFKHIRLHLNTPVKILFESFFAI